MEPKEIGIFLGVGLVAGFLASLILGGGSLVYYLLIGVLGSVVGSFVLGKLNVKISTGNELVNKIIIGAIGAIIVVIVARLIA